MSASACHIGGPKGVRPGQKALLHGGSCLVKVGGKKMELTVFNYRFSSINYDKMASCIAC